MQKERYTVNPHTEVSEKEVYLFDRNKLTTLSKWQEIEDALGERRLSARPLKLSDYSNGYLELLAELTAVGEISEHEFRQRFNYMKSSNEVKDHYVVVVIEDINSKRVVGASTLFLEMKFIHQCAMRGRLEDVAVRKEYRGKQIGELVVKIIVELAREAYNCYKLSLDCSDGLKKFYAKNDFVYGANMLCIRFDK